MCSVPNSWPDPAGPDGTESATFRALAAETVCVVVTYGDRAGLCARTIEAAHRCGVRRLCLVVNGCGDVTRRQLAEVVEALQGVEVELLISAHNRGSAVAVGWALEAATARWEPPYLWLLDDDNVPDPSSLFIQIQVSREVQGHTSLPAAVCAFRSDLEEHQRTLDCGLPGAAYPYESAFLYFDLIQRVQRFAGHRSRSREQYVDIPYGPYGGLLLPLAVYRQIGPPKDDFVLYEDDTEFTARIGSLGWPLVLSLRARVRDADLKWHGNASRRGSRRLLESNHRTRLFYATRNRVFFETRYRLGCKWRFILNLAVYLLLLAPRCRSMRNGRNLVVILRAVSAGLLGLLGTKHDFPLEQPDFEGTDAVTAKIVN